MFFSLSLHPCSFFLLSIYLLSPLLLDSSAEDVICFFLCSSSPILFLQIWMCIPLSLTTVAWRFVNFSGVIYFSCIFPFFFFLDFPFFLSSLSLPSLTVLLSFFFLMYCIFCILCRDGLFSILCFYRLCSFHAFSIWCPGFSCFTPLFFDLLNSSFSWFFAKLIIWILYAMPSLYPVIFFLLSVFVILTIFSFFLVCSFNILILLFYLCYFFLLNFFFTLSF